MKPEAFQTPIADAIWDRHSEDGDDFSYDMYLSHQAVEKKLALAVAALKEIENSDDHGYVKLETVNSIAHRVLEQIEEGE